MLGTVSFTITERRHKTDRPLLRYYHVQRPEIDRRIKGVHRPGVHYHVPKISTINANPKTECSKTKIRFSITKNTETTLYVSTLFLRR